MHASPITQVSKDDQTNVVSYDDGDVPERKGGCFGFLSTCLGGGSSSEPPRARAVSSVSARGIHPSEALLPPQLPIDKGKHTLVLDLDETLVHSSFKPVHNADFIIPVEIEDTIHQVYVLKRPYVDEFMENVAKWFEVVVFTASLSKYADPVLDLLDIHQVVRARLFREGCVHHQGSFVKDLSRMGRSLKTTTIIDNSPASYLFHPQNAIPIESWFDDPSDTDLLDLLSFLEDLSKSDDVVSVLSSSYG